LSVSRLGRAGPEGDAGPIRAFACVCRIRWLNMCDFSHISGILRGRSGPYMRFFVHIGDMPGPIGTICAVFRTYRGSTRPDRGYMCDFSHILEMCRVRSDPYVRFFVHIGCAPGVRSDDMYGFSYKSALRQVRCTSFSHKIPWQGVAQVYMGTIDGRIVNFLAKKGERGRFQPRFDLTGDHESLIVTLSLKSVYASKRTRVEAKNRCEEQEREGVDRGHQAFRHGRAD